MTEGVNYLCFKKLRQILATLGNRLMEFARSSVDRDKILIYERELRKDKFRLEHQSRQRHRMGRYPF